MSLLVGPMVHDPYRRKRSTKMKDANVAVPTGLLDSLPATIAVRHSAGSAPVHVYAAITFHRSAAGPTVTLQRCSEIHQPNTTHWSRLGSSANEARSDPALNRS
jgi:hypothetical protein